MLSGYGIRVKGPLFDTMMAHYLLEPDMRHNMDLLAAKYLNYEPVHIEELIGERGPRQKTCAMLRRRGSGNIQWKTLTSHGSLRRIFEPHP